MDEQLEQLVIEVQRYDSQTQERQQALSALVDEILRSRKSCRPLRDQSLWGVYLKLYQDVRQQLWQEVEQTIDQYNPRRSSGREWTKALRDRVFSQVLTDAQLKKLALEAQQHPPDTELRQYALRELVQAIWLSKKLCRPHLGRFHPDFYELIYDEAVNKTLTYVCQNIDKYDPERGKDKRFMTWVNFRLDKLVIESPYELSHPQTQPFFSLADLENIPQPESCNPLPDELKDCLENDRDNVFKRQHIRNHPEANFQVIALATLAGKSWETISEELGIRVPTLSSFFRRCCQKFAAKLEQYL